MPPPEPQTSEKLEKWNALPPEAAAAAILPCCGSRAWAAQLAAHRPLQTPESLASASDAIWSTLPREAWLEAFSSHPRIGQTHAPATKQSLTWSVKEQSTATPDDSAKASLAEANRLYEQKFDRIFIICATGKSAPEILTILKQRMHNDPETELLEAAEQQRQITQLRLRKWLEQE